MIALGGESFPEMTREVIGWLTCQGLQKYDVTLLWAQATSNCSQVGRYCQQRALGSVIRLYSSVLEGFGLGGFW